LAVGVTVGAVVAAIYAGMASSQGAADVQVAGPDGVIGGTTYPATRKKKQSGCEGLQRLYRKPPAWAPGQAFDMVSKYRAPFRIRATTGVLPYVGVTDQGFLRDNVFPAFSWNLDAITFELHVTATPSAQSQGLSETDNVVQGHLHIKRGNGRSFGEWLGIQVDADGMRVPVITSESNRQVFTLWQREQDKFLNDFFLGDDVDATYCFAPDDDPDRPEILSQTITDMTRVGLGAGNECNVSWRFDNAATDAEQDVIDQMIAAEIATLST
jgi:hypothetical protein